MLSSPAVAFSRPASRAWLLTLVRQVFWQLSLALLALGGSACEGCRTPSAPPGADGATSGSDVGTPQARLYLVSDMAGALEPCGCVKDQLGGMDHFGALVAAEKKTAPASATLAAGPLFFMDMDLSPEKRAQEITKADTIAGAMNTVGLAGFAPGRNEWAASDGTLASLVGRAGAPLLAADLTSDPRGAGAASKKWTVRTVGGVKLGIVGVAAPDKADKATTPLEGVSSSPPIPAVKEAVAALKKEGVQAIVVLAAVGRGEAKRIADDNPEVLAILVGSTGQSGDTNTKAAPPEQIGDVLVVETANHLQTVGVLDLYVRDRKPGPSGLLRFADGTGIEQMRKRQELSERTSALRAKVATWEKDSSIAPADLEARRADIRRLEGERDALDKSPAPPSGNFYRFSMKDIREQLGADEAVKSQMLAYYKKVDDDNKVAFKDKLPRPAAKGEPKYVGIDTCTNCHEDARKVWDGTRHAHAYETLSKQFKEANLDCVGCHVTGYDRPGGSTVTHVDDLKDVQCEVCHGPGSLHAAATKPEKVPMPTPKPQPDSCLSCHHPPHVHEFDAKAKLGEILGPGHGKPK
jgi:2',3'-cyclic-nucleotide 2'-phosphodiesterase (5'-nucleotidase family)